MIWQLNDVSPTISWSIASHSRVPKLTYHAVHASFAPLSVTVRRQRWDWSASQAPGRQPKEAAKWECWISRDGTGDKEKLVNVCIHFLSARTGKAVQQPLRHDNVSILRNESTIVCSGCLPQFSDEENTPKSAANFESWGMNVLIHAVVKPSATELDCPFAILLSTWHDALSEHISWPDPLKWVSLTNSPRDVSITTRKDPRGKVVELSVWVFRPIKGFCVEESETLKVATGQNGRDLVNGPHNIKIQTIADEERIWVWWLGVKAMCIRDDGRLDCLSELTAPR